MSIIKCIFCGNKKKRAKEHVFPLWLQEHLSLKGDKMLGSHLSSTGKTLSTRVQSAGSILLGHVCEDCNCKWMAALERQAASCFKPVLPKPPVKARWSSDNCSTIAVWAFKTALVLHETSNYRKYIPKRHYQFLYMKNSIPQGIVVDLALDIKSTSLRWRQSQLGIGNFPNSKKDDIASAMKESYRITMGFGSILICVAFWPLQEYVLFRSLNNYRRIWPDPGFIDFSIQPINSIDEFDLDLFFRHSKLIK